MKERARGIINTDTANQQCKKHCCTALTTTTKLPQPNIMWALNSATERTTEITVSLQHTLHQYVLAINTHLAEVDLSPGGITRNGAGVLTVRQADEAGLAPACAPGVAHLPVAAGPGIHAHCLHAMVDALAAGVHDASGVGVP